VTSYELSKARRVSLVGVIVKLRNPDREVAVTGPLRVRDLLVEVGLHPNAVLVIRERELLTGEDTVADSDTVEVRPVISGGVH
jgi:sulfur carrier protein ThiS